MKGLVTVMGYDEIRYYSFSEEDRRRLIERLRLLLEGRVRLAYLFGGITRRRRVRDVDVAVYATPPFSLERLLSVGAELEIALGVPVDLVQLQDLDPSFRLRVLRSGIPVILDKPLHYRLISQAISEIEDIKISIRRFRSCSS